MSVLSPFVFWAQNEKNIFIKVDLKDVKVSSESSNLHLFKALS